MENSQLDPETGTPPPARQGSGITRLFQHSAIYSVSTSIQRLQGLLLTPIYTSTLYLTDTSQYSNYGLVYTFIAFMNFVYLFGMDSAFLRYFFLGKTDRKTVFSTTVGILFPSGVILSLFLFLFSDAIAGWVLFSPRLGSLIRLGALILFLDSLANIPFLILRAEERPVSYSVFRMIRFLMELLLNLLLVVVYKLGVPGILYANILAAFINLLMMLPIALKYLTPRFDRSLLGEMVRFGLPFLPNGIAFMTMEMIDRFLVTKFLGKEILAFYHANHKFATILLLLVVGFRSAWQPFFLRTAKQAEAPSIYSRIFTYYLIIAGGVVVLTTLFVKPVLTYRYFNTFYLLGENYWQGIDFIPWIILSYLFFGVYVIFTPAFFIHKKSQYMVIFTGCGAVINIILNLWLLPAIGIWGAVVANVFAYAVMACSIAVVAQHIYPTPLAYKKMAVLILMVGVIYLVYYITDIQIGLRLILFLLYLAGVGSLILSPAERGRLKNMIRRIRRE